MFKWIKTFVDVLTRMRTRIHYRKCTICTAHDYYELSCPDRYNEALVEILLHSNTPVTLTCVVNKDGSSDWKYSLPLTIGQNSCIDAAIECFHAFRNSELKGERK